MFTCFFTYMRNLENKANEPTYQNRSRVIDTETRQVVAKGEGVEGRDGVGAGVSRCDGGG